MRPRDDLVEVVVDDEAVVYDPVTDIVRHFDRPGTAIWRGLDGRTDVAGLTRRIAESAGVDDTVVAADVSAFVAAAERDGLLGFAAPAGGAERRHRLRQDAASAAGTGPGMAAVQDAGFEQPYRTRVRAALAHAFRVHSNDPDVCRYLGDVTAALPGSTARHADYAVVDAADLRGGGPYTVLHRATPSDPGQVLAVTPWSDRALAVLLWHVNSEAARITVADRPVVHAAAATFGAGAVLLPARPESGKSTTVAGLVWAGFGYLSDEAVAIDPSTCRVQPYPRALSIDRGSWGVLADLRPSPDDDRLAGQWQVPPDRIRPGAVADAAPVRLVIAPQYRSGARTVLSPVSRAKMLLHLVDSTFHFQRHAARNLTVLADLVRAATCWRMTIGDLDEAVAHVVDLVAESEQFDVAESEPPRTESGNPAVGAQRAAGEDRPLPR